jgi:aspartyl/asparaginyl beta-hydroxylase (cupin superfamily)
VTGATPGRDPGATQTLARRAFYDPADFPFLADIRARLPALRAEAQEVVNRLAHMTLLYGFGPRSAKDGFVGEWARYYLELAGMRFELNRRLSPETHRTLALIPGLVAAGFYILGPRSHVLPHTGVCENVLRAHLGLICPEGCRLRIGGDVRAWREGEFLVFDDTLDHEAWNDSDRIRCVLNVDFLHPADQEPTLWPRQSRALLEANVNLDPGKHVWLSAGEVRIRDEDLQAAVDATTARVRAAPEGEARYQAIRRMVETVGLIYV